MTLEEEYRLSCYEELTTLDDHEHIYLVKHKLSGEIFVKKVLQRFSFDVYEQLMKLHLPGIPQIHDMILDHDHLILIEDYIHGQTLEQMLANDTTISETNACKIILKLCEILKNLHTLTPPIIHRDLKLSNIILLHDDSLYIVDFDTARYYESGQEEDTQLLGTKEYAAPEQYGFGQSDTRSDIYALGIIFNRLLTGQYPKHQLSDGHFKSVIEKCIRWEPDERFQTVDELLVALNHCISPDENLKRDSISTFNLTPPGFRTRTFWKMLVALMGYLSCFYCCATITITETGKSIPLTGIRLWYERIFMLIVFLSLIFYNCDYLNIRTLSFRGRSFPLLVRILLQWVISILILFLLVLIMLLIEDIIW